MPSRKNSRGLSVGYVVALVWLEVCGGRPRKTLGKDAMYLNTVQRLMRRHIGLEILEETFAQAARDAGYLVDMGEDSWPPRAPLIGVSRLAMRAVELDCQARAAALGGYSGTALARASAWPVHSDNAAEMAARLRRVRWPSIEE